MSRNYLKEDETRREELLDKLGVNREDLKRDVLIFRDWGKQQKHLPQEDLEDDKFIERLLLNNKLRIEQSKTKLDNYYTFKSLYNFFYNDLEKIVPTKQTICRIPLKQRTLDGRCIILICIWKEIHDKLNFLEGLKLHTLITEIINKYCYISGRLVIIDCKGIKMGIFDNFDVSIFHKHLKTMKHCFGGSSSTFHIINMSNWGHALLSGVGMLFPKEVSARITVHQDIKSLYKVIPKSYLPKNYGGEDISIEEYIEIWNDIVKEEESFLKSLQYKIPNESLRIEQHQENPDGYGVDGTFKKLNID